MKNITKIITICIMLLLISKTVTAQEYQSFDVVSSSDESYNFKCQIKNFTMTSLKYTPFINQPLKNYSLMSNPIKANGYETGNLQWENPDYIIIRGSQYVNILFTNYGTQEVITFSIYINGVDLPLKKINMVNEEEYLNCDYDIIEGKDIKEVIQNFIFKSQPMTYDSLESINVKGTTIIDNTTNLAIGSHKINWTFTPIDSSYETKHGTIKININPNTEVEIVETTTTTLTASSLLLEPTSQFDINLVDKEYGSTYIWKSSNTSVASVSTKGNVIAKKDGTAKITCKVTTTTDSYTLTSNVTVGIDENAPLLTETILDLSVGDYNNVNIENKLSKSTYKFSTSDRTVVKVNLSSGKIICVDEGSAVITCVITTSEKQVIVLKCEVNVSPYISN